MAHLADLNIEKKYQAVTRSGIGRLRNEAGRHLQMKPLGTQVMQHLRHVLPGQGPRQAQFQLHDPDRLPEQPLQCLRYAIEALLLHQIHVHFVSLTAAVDPAAQGFSQ